MPLSKDDCVTIAESSADWALEFQKLANTLRVAVHDAEVEHIGSTAVPGLPAKPILDVVVLHHGEPEAERIRGALQTIGYASEGERGVPGRESFRRKSAATPETGSAPWMDHHLYLADENSAFLRDQRLFRDYLLSHPDTARSYSILKSSLAAAFSRDREAYTEAKGPFVRAVLAAARLEKEGSRPTDTEQRPTKSLETFTAVDLRVGTVVEAHNLANARRPAIVMNVDFGHIGRLASSAQITDHYGPERLLGRQVVAVVNIEPRQVGKVMSRCLVLGASDGTGIRLLAPDETVPDGSRVH